MVAVLFESNPVFMGVQPRPAVSKSPTRIGNMGHLTRLANRINQASNSNPTIQGHLQVHGVSSYSVWWWCTHVSYDLQVVADLCSVGLQGNPKWSEWVSKVLQQRNTIENVFQWSCGYVSWIRVIGGCLGCFSRAIALG